MITTMKFAVTGQRIELTEPVMLVAETVHIYTASFVFNSTWDGYTKTAVFRGGDVEREQLLTDDSCEVPWEVLVAGKYLRVGVYGTKDDIRLPTIWTERTQYINSGAGPTEEAAEPSPTLVEQLMTKVGNLDALKTEDKSSVVAAVNELKETGGGGGTSDHSKLKNRDAAAQHPMSAITGLEKALEGKQPTGSYLTDKDLDATLKESGKAADAKATGDALRSLSEEKINKSGWAADKYLGTDDSGNVVEKEAPNGDSAGLPENLAYLQDVTVDEASGDFMPMLSPNGTEYRLSIGDDGIPIIKNISGTTVWTGTSGGTGGDSGGESGGDSGGGSDSGDNADWVSGAEISYTVIDGEYPSKTDGTILQDPGGYSRTDYVYCYGAGYLYTNGNGSQYNVFYDVNKQFISAFTRAGNDYIPIPGNAVYFVCSASTLGGFVCKLYKNVEPSWTDGQAYSLSFVADEYVDNTTGVFTAYSGWKRTDYLNCVGASKISRTDGGEKLNYCALYNAEKEFRSQFYIGGTGDVTIPTGACYAVFSGKNSVMDALALVPYA